MGVIEMSMLAKIVLLGDGGVGKTALRKSYLGQGFQTKYVMTIGADFSVKQEIIDGREWKFQIWDLAGQQRFEMVRALYYAGAIGAILVFDVTRPDSLINLKNWIDELHAHSHRDDVPILIVGNKVDIRHDESHVSTEQGLEFAERIDKELENTKNVQYIETSAKTGLNVIEAFRKLAEAIKALIQT